MTTTLSTRLARTMTRTQRNAWASAFMTAFGNRTITDGECARANRLRDRGIPAQEAAQTILDERFI